MIYSVEIKSEPMFLPYKIKSKEIQTLVKNHLINRNFLKEYGELKEMVENNVDERQIEADLIKGVTVQEQWFPVDKVPLFDVFISHSHKDLNKDIKPLASWLYSNLGLRCFIDSLFWQYADRLQNMMDKCYAQRTNGNYDYKIRNYTTSHVHTMLSMALMKMMSKTECVLFVDSDNSIIYKKGQFQTPSPWIYAEIGFAQNLQMTIPDRYLQRLVPVCESGGKVQIRTFSEKHEMNIMYDVDLSQFYEISADSLCFAKRNGNFGNKALDYLHEKALKKYRRSTNRNIIND